MSTLIPKHLTWTLLLMLAPASSVAFAQKYSCNSEYTPGAIYFSWDPCPPGQARNNPDAPSSNRYRNERPSRAKAIGRSTSTFHENPDHLHTSSQLTTNRGLINDGDDREVRSSAFKGMPINPSNDEAATNRKYPGANGRPDHMIDSERNFTRFQQKAESDAMRARHQHENFHHNSFSTPQQMDTLKQQHSGERSMLRQQQEMTRQMQNLQQFGGSPPPMMFPPN
jgi:hypothetical protein